MFCGHRSYAMNTPQDLVLVVLIAAGALAGCAFALRFRNQFDRTVEALKDGRSRSTSRGGNSTMTIEARVRGR